MDYLSEIPEFKQLIIKRQLFVRNYLGQAQRVAADAVRLTGYKTKSPAVYGGELMADPKIKYILDQYDRKMAAANGDMRLKIIKELSVIAFSNIKNFTEWANNAFNIKDSNDIPDEYASAIAEVSEQIGMFGSSKKIKLNDKIAALKELNKMHGFYADTKVEINPGDKGTVSINVTLPSNGREKK